MTEKDVDRILATLENLQRDFTAFKESDFADFKTEVYSRLDRSEMSIQFKSDRAEEDRKEIAKLKSEISDLKQDRSKVIGGAAATGGLFGGLITFVKHLLGG